MSADDTTLFQLPTNPDQFSVLLPPSELRKVDFSALEFSTARRAIVEYIKTYFPDDFNDFVSNNGIMMLVELLAYITGVLSLRGDLQANEAFLPSAQTENAVINHLALINQSIKEATPAVVDVECSIQYPTGSDIRIPAGQQFEVAGSDGDITYEVFKSPTDFTSDIIIPAGKHGVVAYGVEGQTNTTTVTSDGTANQSITINTNRNVLGYPIDVVSTLGSVTSIWNRIDTIERGAPQDKVYEMRIFSDHVEFIFGDNVTGAIPSAGSDITIKYRIGGGSRGRIGVGVINVQKPFVPEYPYKASVPVLFRNVTPSSGGVDRETIQQAKKRAPRDFATHDSIITESDYSQIAGAFSHPAFGAVAKAVATVRTGLNANLVELYILTYGPNGPATPNEGLKRALRSYVDELNVLTDTVEVLDGKVKPVDLNITVVMNKNVDASVVRGRVEYAISQFFDISNWDMGESFYVSQLYDAINKVDGVKYVDIFAPVDNILASGKLESADSTVAINELIVLGSSQIQYYYEAFK